jgi:carbon-monoxide dehydrogenase large subunit
VAAPIRTGSSRTPTPAAADAIEAARFVGARVHRKEDPRLLAGRGRYVDDVTLPGLLHVAFVRSTHARARLDAIDTRAAAALPGVHAVLTYDDLAAAGRLDAVPGPVPLRPLAVGEVRFVGDPVVLVVADSRAIAEDACELVVVDYEPLPAMIDPRAAIADTENLVHPELGGNVVGRGSSPHDDDLERTFATADLVVRERIAQHRYLAVPMETRGIVASWEHARDEMTIWLSTQGAHMARDHFAAALGLDPPRVRVIVDDVGGAFGQKINVGRDETAVALAAIVVGRPVKWIEDRWENLVAAPHARWEEADVAIALDRDGHILAMHVDHIADAGAYAAGAGVGGAGLPMIVRFLPGPYRVPQVGGSSATAITNTSRRGAYRGPWLFETVAREILLDIAARRARLDPLEVRRRNVIRASDLPYTTAVGTVLDHITPAETLEQAVALVGYDDFRREQAAARLDGRYLGIGLALFVEPTASGFGMGITEAATVRIDTSGKVQVLTSVNSQGHSVETTLAQVAADQLGVGIDDITVLHGDTAVAPVGATTGGSRNAIFGGGAVRQSALEMRGRILRIASHAMEAAVEDLDIADSVVSVRGTPSAHMTLSEIAQLAYMRPRELPDDVPPGLEVATRFTTEGPTWSNAAHAVTCEVDVHTGLVTLLRYVVSEDCGTVINPMVVEGQISGGVVQGIGGTLLEHFVYDADGTPLTTTFLDYLLPTAPDVPPLQYGHIETPSARPGGFKGMGEGGAIAAPAAVFNAVADALSPFGVTLTRQPLTPDAVLDAVSTDDGS